MIQYTHYNGTYYCINAYHDFIKNNDFLTIDKCEKELWKTYAIKISDTENDYVYKIQKTQVISKGGIMAIYDHFKTCIDENFAIDAWVINPIEQIISNVKKYSYSDYFKNYEVKHSYRDNSK